MSGECDGRPVGRFFVCVIDPEGDYASLEAFPGVTVLGGEDPPSSTPQELIRADRVLIRHTSRPEELGQTRIACAPPGLNCGKLDR